MISPGAVVLVVVALGASLFAAWTIGAGSSGATPFAPAVGANAITTLRAAFIVGILGFLGAVVQGAAVTETVGAGLIDGVTLTPLASAIALTIAASYIAAGVFAGYPIATAFAITGSVVGVGLAMGGDPAWDSYLTIGFFWLLTPVVMAPPGYFLTKILRGERISNTVILPILAGSVGVVLAHMEFIFFGPAGEQASFAATTIDILPIPPLVGYVGSSLALALLLGLAVHRAIGNDPIRAQQRFLLALGALVAFTAGGGKVGLAVGPLLPIAEGSLPIAAIVPVLLFGGIGILLGSWMAAPRMIKALSQDYSQLGPRRSIAVLIPSFVVAQAGIYLGVPMSFNQIFIAAMAGVGYAVGRETVSERKLLFTAFAWVGSLVFGLIVGYVVYTVATFVTGVA